MLNSSEIFRICDKGLKYEQSDLIECKSSSFFSSMILPVLYSICHPPDWTQNTEKK